MRQYQLSEHHVTTLEKWAHGEWAAAPEGVGQLSLQFLLRTEFLRRHIHGTKFRPTIAGMAVISIRKLPASERQFLDALFNKSAPEPELSADTRLALIESLRGKGLIHSVAGVPRLAGHTVRALGYMHNL